MPPRWSSDGLHVPGLRYCVPPRGHAVAFDQSFLKRLKAAVMQLDSWMPWAVEGRGLSGTSKKAMLYDDAVAVALGDMQKKANTDAYAREHKTRPRSSTRAAARTDEGHARERRRIIEECAAAWHESGGLADVPLASDERLELLMVQPSQTDEPLEYHKDKREDDGVGDVISCIHLRGKGSIFFKYADDFDKHELVDVVKMSRAGHAYVFWGPARETALHKVVPERGRVCVVFRWVKIKNSCGVKRAPPTEQPEDTTERVSPCFKRWVPTP